MMFGRRRPDKDFGWWEAELSARLGPLQQRLGPTADLSHVIREHGEEFAQQLSDAAIAQVIEQTRGHQGTWVAFRGRLLAEQARRSSAQGKFSNRVTVATLIVAAVGAVASLVALGK